MRGIEPAGGIAQFAQRYAIEALQAGGILRIALVDPEPVVLGVDPNHQGVAQQLGAITAAALLSGQTTIHGEQPQIEMRGTPTVDPQSKTGGGPCGLRPLKRLQ